MVDEFGHCVVCHANLIVERAVDGKVIKMFTTQHSETEFMLNDGSRMRVCICKNCKESIDLKDKKIQNEIMGCVLNGWKKQVDELVANPQRPDWNMKRGKKYMSDYSAKRIISHTESLSKHRIRRAS